MTVSTVKSDDRRASILSAAFESFSNYGFRRTSMEDIAKAAGISRPALYQNFSSKGDIFNGMVQQFLEQACKDMQDQLAQPIGVVEKLDGLFEISLLEPHRMIESLPHGDEVLGLKAEFAQDVFDEWMARSQQAYREALLQEPGLDRDLAEDLAGLMSDTILGMKSRNATVPELESGLARMMRVVKANLDLSGQ